jgi:hypothetical protein
MSNADVIKALNEPTPKNRIKFRIGYKHRSGVTASMLGYVDARYVMDRLDSAVGQDSWSASYQVVGDTMFCTLEVTWPDGQVTNKTDCGVETDVEGEKGKVSDAFKRAAVHYGIGRDLYSLGDFVAPLDSKGYVEKNWQPDGWDSSSMNSGQDDSTSVPTTTNASASQPSTEKSDRAMEVVNRIADKQQEHDSKAQNTPEIEETPQTDTQTPLKQGTPPEDEDVVVKSLTKVTESPKAILFLPPDFKGETSNNPATKNYWIPKQYIKEMEAQMSGKYNIVVARWIVEQTLPDGSRKYHIEGDVPF